MSQFSKAFLQKIRDMDIFEMAEKYFNPEEKAGVARASCTHGSDTTPSLHFYRKTNSFYCFGCGAGRKPITQGSDIISFVMWMEDLEFPDAVEVIASHFNIPIETETPKIDPERTRLLKKHIEMNRVYWKTLQESDWAREYLEARGISQQEIDKWRIGLVPHDHTDYAGKMAFAILNQYGNTVAFSYRDMNEQRTGPKYINTGNSPIFEKSHILYGYNFIREKIDKRGFMVVGEGFADAIIGQKLDLPFVSIMGTGMSSYQAAMIAAQTHNVILWMDGDAPGKQAAERIAETLRTYGVMVMVIHFDGKDPDDILLEIDRMDISEQEKQKAARNIIRDHAVLASHMKIEEILNIHDSRMTELQTRTMKEILPILEQINSTEERAFTEQMVARRMNLSPEQMGWKSRGDVD